MLVVVLVGVAKLNVDVFEKNKPDSDTKQIVILSC